MANRKCYAYILGQAVLSVIVAALLLPTATAENATLRVEVIMPDGSPASDVPVTLMGLYRENISAFDAGHTDANGAIEIEFKPESHHRFESERPGYGPWRVIAEAGGYAPAVSGVFVWSDDDALYSGVQQRHESATEAWESGESFSNWAHTHPTRLHSGETHELRLEFEQGESVTLRLKDSLDRPIANYELRVEICLQGQSRMGWGPTVEVTNTNTDDEGYFTIPNVADHVHAFWIEGEGRRKYVSPQSSVRDGVHRFHPLREEGPIVFEVDTGKQIKIRVLDAETGEPLPQTMLNSAMSFPSTTQSGVALWADDQGRLVVNNYPTLRVASVSLAREGYESARLDIDEIPDGEWKTVELEPTDDPDATGPRVDPPEDGQAGPSALGAWSQFVEGEVTVGSE